MHLYGDVGPETGDLGTVIVNSHASGTSLQITPGERYTASCAVMVMRRIPETGAIFIETAYPELPLSTTAREEFPALCHFFGPWFGQDREHPILSMQQSFRATSPARLDDLGAELDRLLARSDDEMRLVLESCGSYVLPTAVRPWLEATRWRVGAFDWGTTG